MADLNIGNMLHILHFIPLELLHEQHLVPHICYYLFYHLFQNLFN